MKLLLIPSQYPASAKDPTGIFVRDQARALALRHDVTVIQPRLLTPRAWLRRSMHSAARSSESSAGVPRDVREITIVIPNLTNRLQGLTHRLWRNRVTARAAGWVNDGTIPRPDVVHAHVVRPAGAAAITLARYWKAKSVLTEHSGPFSVHLRTDALRQSTHATLRQFDAVVAVSPFLEAEIRSVFSDLTPKVVGNVVDETFFVPGPADYVRVPGQPFRFLFVGGLTWHKGVDVLLAAAARLRDQGVNDWQLVIVGDGPDRTSLEKQIAALRLQPNVTMEGSQPRDVVRAWIRSADALVQPSRIETFCVVLIEAMACGVPVIATDSGGPSWIVRPENGNLVPVGDSGALANAMASMRQERTPFDPRLIRSCIISRFGRVAWLNEIEKVYAGL